jgi:diacylglycerol kinase family enzyme
LGIIPLGTANVLAAEIGVSTRPERIAAIIAGGNHKRIRIGEISNHRFVMMAGVGFDARTVTRVTPGLKRLTGKLAYVIAAFSELTRYKAARLRLTLDGIEMTAASAVIANGHYYAGRFVLAPEARLDEAVLHVCLFERAGRWNQVRYALAMALGRVSRLPDVRIIRANSGVIEGSENEPVQADGDFIGRTPIAFALLPGSLTMLVP